jgi:lysophospholipase L1-like esterase
VSHIALIVVALALACTVAGQVRAAEPTQWVVAWAGSVQGPYPVGNATAQPELSFAFPNAEQGATDQTFRLIVRPDIWGRQARLRLSNAFGTRPVTFDGAFVGLQTSGAALLPGSNRKVTFGGKPGVTVPAGEAVTSDPVGLSFVHDPADPMLIGRKLAVSFHVAGSSGPMTWHAKGLRTSYISSPHSGSLGGAETEAAFPFSTTSWYFLDAVAMAPPADTRAVVAFGDSITDGTASTLNGDDRWPDVFARRLHAAVGNRWSVVNAGIGGNQVVGPSDYTGGKPTPGGPSAVSRIDRDVTSLPGVGAVIWLEGINDFGTCGASVAAVEDGYRQGVAQLRAKLPHVKVYVGTLTSALHSTPTHGTPEVDAKRQALNGFLRSSGLFDGVVDFAAATVDPTTGALKAEYQPNSTIGGPGDRLHPNRAGYAAMGQAIELKAFGAR